MRSRIGRRLLRLVLIPVAGLVFVFAFSAILETQTLTTESWLRHSAVVIQLSQQAALEIARADSNASPDATGRERDARFRAIAGDFAALRALVSDNPSQLERLKAYERSALAHLRRPRDSRATQRLAVTQRGFDVVEADLQIERRDAADRLRTASVVGLALAVLVAVALTFGVYRTLSLDVARRLEELSLNARRVWTGEDVGPADTGSDEIADVDALVRLTYEMLANREKATSRYKVLAEQTSDIMFFLDGPNIVEANEAAAHAYGYTRAHLETLTIFDLRVPELHTDVHSLLSRLPEVVERYETVHRRRDGSRFPVDVLLRQTTIAGRPLVFVVARDISARREADARLRSALLAANEASRLKSEFVAMMSHEIRTPMNAILGMTELLLDSSLDLEQHDLASTVRSSGQALLRIIDDVLDFSKMEAGKLGVEAREFDLVSCVESVAHLLSPQLQRKGIAFTTFVPPECPPLVLGDEIRVRQVLTNLIGNAMKFTDQGTVTVTSSIRTTTETTIAVRFAISDTGIGLDADARDRLFSAFVQADGSITRRYGGTGLGLAISKRLVELMGGTIGVTSELGVGSTFWFELPFEVVARAPRVERTLRCGPILVADKNASDRAIVTTYLRAWGAVVEEADSYEAALRACARRAADRQPYALVLTDTTIAPDDVPTLVGDLRRASGNPKTQVVLTSSFDTIEFGRRAVRTGFCAFLVKPLRQTLLFDCVASFAQPSAHSDEAPPARILPVPIEREIEGACSRGHALYVEDNSVNQRVGRKQLEKIGFTVTCADNGCVAVDAIAREHYDIVFMDLQMPEMDGITATRAIRRHEIVSGTRVPIVALTAESRVKERAACLESGMDDFLVKPVSLAELRSALARWVPTSLAFDLTTGIPSDGEI